MYGSYGVFSRYLGDYDIFFQTYIRCLLIAGILGVIGLIRKEFKPIKKEDVKWFAAMGFFSIFSIAPIVYAFRYLEIGTASFLFYAAYTIATYIFGRIFFAEKLTSIKIISLVLSFIGLLLIFSIKFSSELLLPVLMAILNGVATSGEITFSKKVSDKYSNNQIVVSLFLLIAISHFFVSLFLGEHQNMEILTKSFFILAGFILAAIIATIAIVEGFKYLEPSIGAIIGLMEIIFSVIFGIIFFSESLTIPMLVGGILIVTAVALPDIVALLAKNKK